MIKQLLQKANQVLTSKRGAHPHDAMDEMPYAVAVPEFSQHVSPSKPSVAATKLDLIVVPQSAMDAFPENPHPLIEAVVAYVNFLRFDAGFQPSDIPTEAMQAYRCDDYHAHVCQGGHGEFIDSNFDDLTKTISDLMCGLIAMGEPKYQRIAGDMAACVATGDITADALKKLDQPFYVHDKKNRFTMVLAAWIAQLEIVVAVPDGTLKQAYAGVAKVFGKARKRMMQNRTDTFAVMLDDPIKLGFGLAGGTVKNPVIRIGGSLRMDVDGEMTPAWLVDASNGKCWGVIDEHGATFRERLLDESAAEVTVGEILSQVSDDDIDTVRMLCDDLNAAAAIDLLITQFDPEMDVDFLSVHTITGDDPEMPELMIYVVASGGETAFTARISAQDAMLLAEPSHDVVASVSRIDIEKHTTSPAHSVAA